MSLPMLPGYRLNKNPKKTHSKSHVFDIKQGTRAETGAIDGATIPVDLPSPFDDAVLSNTARTDVNGTLSQLPSWVEYNRKVLRFFCYFKEAVFASSIETYRIRKCVLYYYLEDDTIHVAEPKIENSGMAQGVLIKRHRCPKEDNSLLSIQDMQVDSTISIYGRIFYIYDADEFTRSFYSKHGTELNGAVSVPDDTFAIKTTKPPANHNKEMYPMKAHMEAALGKPTLTNIEQTQQFLENDKKVLRFYCLDDDKRLFGEPRPFILHFFLADDTIEVAEVKDANNSRDGFAMFLRRCKLPFDFKDMKLDIQSIGNSAENTKFYSPVDLKVGSYVKVYGKELKIMGCDSYTQNYYTTNYGWPASDFPTDLLTSMDVPEKDVFIQAPLSNGYGTEEDSLGSFIYLNPKIPKEDYRKLLENEGIILRFLAKFTNPAEIDEDRTFIIAYYMADDQIQVFENFQRNSGFIGGKFLEKSRQFNKDTQKYFEPKDLKLGNVVTINGFEYVVTEIDVYTQKFIANNPEIF